MKKAVLSFFVAFALLLAPIAHAFDIGCGDDTCQMGERIKNDQKQDIQQDNDNIVGAGHHCCCPHISLEADARISALTSDFTKAAFLHQDVFMSSVVQGTPLKPPSHAYSIT